nr:spike protein [Infectious bronchitis virus]
MLVKLPLLVTLLFVVVEGGIVGDNYTYYYQSEYRPPDGWNHHGGAYKVVNVTSFYNNAGSANKCPLGSLHYADGTRGHIFNASAISMTAPSQGMEWSASEFCTAYCNFTMLTVFVTHCTGAGNPCSLTGDLGVGKLGIHAQQDGKLVFNKTVTTMQYARFMSLHCINNQTTVVLNGDIVFTSNYTANVAEAGVSFKAGGPVQYRIMQEFHVLAYFLNGSVHDVILCDDSPRGRLACQYNTGNFTDGMYPFTVNYEHRDTFRVYKVSNSTSYGVLHNFTLQNETNAQPNQGDVHTITKYQVSTAKEGFNNFNLSFLDSFVYVGSDLYDFTYGSYHPNCHFSLDGINNELNFNSFSISIGYGPIKGGCKQSVHSNLATCCYAYKYPQGGPIACKGVYNGQRNQNFECGLLVFITKNDGSLIQTSNSVPVFVENFYNNITLDKCVDYNIYGITGQGVVLNITNEAIGYLASNGLVLLDASGAVDVFKVEGPSGPNYYRVKPCDDVNQQYVVSGGSIVGKLTSSNESGSQQLEDLFYVKLSNNYYRHRRSVSQNVTNCPYVSYGKFCIKPDGDVSLIVPEELKDHSSLLLNRTDHVLIPDSFNLTVTEEYIQTQMQQVQINCIQYVCGNSIQCKQLFQQYGPVCDNILSIVNGLVQQDNYEMIQFYSTTKPNGFDTVAFSNFSAGEVNISLILPKNGQPTGRSFVEDLLFTKVESLGLPTDADYRKCTQGTLGFVKDLVCAQHYNGLLVLPPIITAEMQAMYTTSLVASMAFGGITAAGAIPFATQLQARINHLGITQTVLQKNQEKIAASFNRAIGQMQEGFQATSLALQQVQDVVNKQAGILQETMQSLNKNFGAISHVIQDIYKMLNALEANAQVDRLITGRLSALSVLASSKQLEHAKVSQQRELAKQKINECVKSQSSRRGFCGNDMHILTIPQNAPNGILFLHFTYTPETYKNVTAVVGFCVTPDNGTEYGLVPVTGRGVFIQENGTYYITSRDMYNPRAITGGDVVKLTSCQANYEYINKTVITTFVDEDDFNFDHELSKWWNETIRDFPELDQFNYTVPVLNISNEIDRIQQVIQGLNDSLIDLETLSILKTYIKWPWYVWLAIAFATIIFILILGWVFFMTGCCGCCCGCFGIIPLMSKCGKKSSYYTTFDNDVVTEQYRPKKSV